MDFRSSGIGTQAQLMVLGEIVQVRDFPTDAGHRGTAQKQNTLRSIVAPTIRVKHNPLRHLPLWPDRRLKLLAPVSGPFFSQLSAMVLVQLPIVIERIDAAAT
jgi:hypothetical protein